MYSIYLPFVLIRITVIPQPYTCNQTDCNSKDSQNKHHQGSTGAFSVTKQNVHETAPIRFIPAKE